MRGWRVFGAAAVLAAGVSAAGCACGKIEQAVFIGSPDPALQTLVDACRTNAPPAGASCSPTYAGAKRAVSCACEPLCRRVLELIDQFSGAETLMACTVSVQLDGGTTTAVPDGAAPGDAGAGADAGAGPSPAATIRVDVTYRPSTCE